MRERAGEDDGLAGKLAAGGGRGIRDGKFFREIVERLAVMRLVEEIDDVAGDERADLLDTVEIAPRFGIFLARVQHRFAPVFQAAVMPREQLRRRFADLPDAERIDEFIERYAPPRLDGIKQFRGRFLAPPLPFLQSLAVLMQPENIGRRVDEFIFPQLANALIAETFDIEGVAAGKMAQPFDRLRGADEAAGAAPHRHALFAHRV